MGDYRYPYVYRGDFLRLNATSTDASATLTLAGRILTDEGDVLPFAQSMVITGAGNQAPITIPLMTGWIMGFIVYVSAGTITDGEVVASVEVVQASGAGLTRIMSLASGEISNTRTLGLGAYEIAGAGGSVASTNMVVATQANPAAGANLVVTVTAGQVWRLQSLRFTLTNSATVATRSVAINFDDGVSSYYHICAATTQLASQAQTWNIGNVGHVYTPSGGSNFIIPVPEIIAAGGHRISTAINSLQAGDQISNAVISYQLL